MLRLRPAAQDDWARLLQWRNDPATRASFRSTAPVDVDEHVAWFARTLASPEVALFVAHLDDACVGSCRLGDLRSANASPSRLAEVSIVVDPRHRGRGIAVPMLRLLEAEAARRGTVVLRADVRATNTPSLRAFVEAGYALVRCDGDYVRLEREVGRV